MRGVRLSAYTHHGRGHLSDAAWTQLAAARRSKFGRVEAVDQALEAFRAGRAGDGLALLVDAWRACRLPALADAIDRLGPPWPALMLPAEEYTRRWQPVRSRVLATAREPHDPRMLAALVVLFENPPSARETSLPMWRAIIELVIALGDARAAHRLERLWSGQPACLQAPLAAEIAAINAIAPPVEPALARACAVLGGLDADAIRASLPALPPIDAQDTSEPLDPAVDAETRRTLLDACYRDPADDLAREVYADYLMLRGDPRGELIALSLAGRDPDRVAHLIATHAHKWLGPLKRQLHDIEFERGFPARARVDGWSTAMHALLRDTPAASTLRRLTIERVTSADLDGLAADPAIAARVTALRTRDVPITEMLARLAADPFPALASLSLRVSDAKAPTVLGPLFRLPAGERLVELSCTSGEVAAWLDLLDRAPPRLARMSIVMYLYSALAPSTLTFVRDPSGRFSTLDITPGPDERNLGDMLVRTLVPALRGRLVRARLRTMPTYRAPLVKQLTAHLESLGIATETIAEDE